MPTHTPTCSFGSGMLHAIIDMRVFVYKKVLDMPLLNLSPKQLHMNALVLLLRKHAYIVFQNDNWEQDMKKVFPDFVHSRSEEVDGVFEMEWVSTDSDVWFYLFVNDVGGTYLEVGCVEDGTWQLEPVSYLFKKRSRDYISPFSCVQMWS